MEPQKTTTSSTGTIPTETNDEPVRILEILREVGNKQPAVSTPNDSVGSIKKTPVHAVPPSAKKTSSSTTLESMGGTRPEEITPPSESQKIPTTPATPKAKTQPPMRVYAPTTAPKEKPSAIIPKADGVIIPPKKPKQVFPEGLAMKDIVLKSEEKPTAQTFDTTTKSTSPPSTPIPQSPVKKSEFDIPSVRTLRDDMQKVVHGQKISVVKAAAIEEKKRHSQVKKESARKTPLTVAPVKNKRSLIFTLLSISIVLFVLGASSVGGFFWYRAQQEAPLTISKSIPSLIFAEQTKEINISNTSSSLIKHTLDAEFKNNPSINTDSIVHIFTTYTSDSALGEDSITREATPIEFFEAINVSVPAELKMSLNKNFFLGIHSRDENEFILILPISSYERAFSAMLNWEPEIGSSLSPLFQDAPSTITSTDGSFIENKFQDVLVKNFDVRMLADESGTPRILYSFPSRNLLVITSNQYTLLETLARIQAARN